MDNETFQALRPHGPWAWFVAIAFGMGVYLFFLILDYVREKKEGSTRKSVQDLREWFSYALIYVVMAIGTLFFGLVGFWVALVVSCVIWGYLGEIRKVLKKISHALDAINRWLWPR